MPGRTAVMGLLLSPIVTPLIISAVGMFFFYSEVGLAQTHLGLILAHTTLGAPFVVITVTATLSGFDRNLLRASASLGAGPLTGFRRIQLPLIAPGVVSGALFAFATSFDEVVTALHRRPGAAHHPAADVVGHPRGDQPRDPGRRHRPAGLRPAIHGHRRVAAPTRRQDNRTA